MATANEPLRLSRYSQEKLVTYIKGASDSLTGMGAMRATFLEKDRIYQRELDWTAAHLRARAANLQGNSLTMQNVVVPVVMPQVESTHGYLVDTFLSSYPVFPVNSTPQYQDVAKQIDSIMGESANRFQYVRHLSMAFRDGLKYNIQAVEVEWKNLKVYSVGNDARSSVVFGVPTETEFSGNMIKRLDPYNLIFDMRVPVSEVHEKGDYVGYTELLTRIQLKNLFLELDATLTMNADEAFTSATAGAANAGGDADSGQSYYVPQVNPSALRDPAFGVHNWLTWASLDTNNKVQHSDMYEVTTLYMRIIPREAGINTGKAQAMNGVPQIFKTISVNRRVLIYCERKSNAHNYLPIILGQPIEDGLNLQTKSFADNAAPYQFLATSLYNSAILSQRRKVYDRIVYDPSRINKADINNTDPVARIAVKTEAYGKPIGEAFQVMPYRDDGVPQILSMARDVTMMADQSNGQNGVQRGQFQKGNKTLREFDTTMDKSELRPRTMAIVMESSWIQPIKHILKMNILQYQPPAELFNQQTQATVKITPSQLRTIAWQFQVADGILPVSKQFNPEQLQYLMNFASAAPQLFSQYDIGGMVIYNMKLGGANWVDAFKLQPQQATQQAQAVAGPQPNGQNSTTPAVPAATVASA